MAGVTWRNVVFDCRDAVAQAEFWAAALGWEVRRRDPEWSVVSDPREATTHLGFSGVPEPKTVKNRLHLDLLPTEGGSREDERDRLERLGAHLVETVMEDGLVAHDVMADPEGNEFCLLEPYPAYFS